MLGTSIQGVASSNDDYHYTGGRTTTKINLLWVILGLIAIIILVSLLVYGVTLLIIRLCYGKRSLENNTNIAVAGDEMPPAVVLFEDVLFDDFGNPISEDTSTAYSPGRANQFVSTIARPPTSAAAFSSVSQNQN